MLLLCPGAALAAPDTDAALRRSEGALLHRRVNLGGLFQLKRGRWVPGELAPGRPQLLHVWAVECPPCVEELAELRRLAAGLRGSELRLALISETIDQRKLDEFLKQNQKIIPEVEQYQSGDRKLRQSLRVTEQQPLTLLVDEDLVIRQAFVGSIAERRGEVLDAAERLLQVSGRRAREGSHR